MRSSRLIAFRLTTVVRLINRLTTIVLPPDRIDETNPDQNFIQQSLVTDERRSQQQN